MPKIRTQRSKPPPEGYELIESTLEELNRKMRDAENTSNIGKRKSESVWPIFKVVHQRSRYIYDMYYKRKAISKELYDWCLAQDIADKALIAKWKKPGYNNLCCLQCIQPLDTDYKTTCVCRVPRAQLDKHTECVKCGCTGCGGS